MVEAGEAAGILDIVLDRVAFQIEKQEAIRRRVKSAMVYPTMVLIFATLVLIGMLMFLVPIFVKIFASAERPAADADAVRRRGVEPAAQQAVPHPAHPARRIWTLLPLEEDRERPQEVGRVQAEAADADRRHGAEGDDGALLAHALDARRRRRRHHQGARDHRARRPATGSSRTRSPASARRCTRACRSRSRCSRTTIFPPMVAQMVKIGEETGELEKMLSKIADFYEDEVDASVQSLTSIVEPIMMIGVGVMVGIIIISMYMPMFKMLTLVK